MTMTDQTIKCDFPGCGFTSDDPDDFHQQGKIHACKPCADGFSDQVKSGAIDTAIRYNTSANRSQAKLQAKREGGCSCAPSNGPNCVNCR